MNRPVRSSLFLSSLLFLILPVILAAQPVSDAEGDIGIGTLEPHPSSVLDLSSTEKGVLIPRMTTLQRNGMPNPPAEGLMIYNIDLGTLQIWSDASGNWQWDAVETTGANLYWTVSGNSGLSDGVDNYIGTLDGVPLRLIVDTEERFILNVNGSVQRDNGGDTRGDDAVDLQNSRTSSNEVASGDHATIGGGGENTASRQYSTVSGGIRNHALGNFSVIGGGEGNEARVNYTLVAGGLNNLASSYGTSVGGGTENSATSRGANVDGGFLNSAGGQYSTVGGGDHNEANGTASVIAGGRNNIVHSGGPQGTIGGGSGNQVSGFNSVIAGGGTNSASGGSTTIGGGSNNVVASSNSVVAGGRNNLATAWGTAIGGGTDNEATMDYGVVSGGELNRNYGFFSTIAGGRGLQIDSGANGVFGFLGNNNTSWDLGGSNLMNIADSNIALFGNVDLWLGNNDGAASQIRFFEANSTTGDFPNGTNYTSFEAGAQASDINYTLPTSLPNAATSGTDLGSGTMETDAAGTMSWRQSTVATATNLNFGTVAAQSSSDVTVTVTGAAVGDIVNLGVDNAAVLANSCYTAWASAANTITIRFNNYSAGNLAPATTNTFRVQVTK